MKLRELVSHLGYLGLVIAVRVTKLQQLGHIKFHPIGFTLRILEPIQQIAIAKHPASFNLNSLPHNSHCEAQPFRPRCNPNHQRQPVNLSCEFRDLHPPVDGFERGTSGLSHLGGSG